MLISLGLGRSSTGVELISTLQASSEINLHATTVLVKTVFLCVK